MTWKSCGWVATGPGTPGGGIYAFHLELRNSSVETGMETFADGGALEYLVK